MRQTFGLAAKLFGIGLSTFATVSAQAQTLTTQPTSQPAKARMYVPEVISDGFSQRTRSSKEAPIEEKPILINNRPYVPYKNEWQEDNELDFMLRDLGDTITSYSFGEACAYSVNVPTQFYIPTLVVNNEGVAASAITLEERGNAFTLDTFILRGTEYFHPIADEEPGKLSFHFIIINPEENNVTITSSGEITILAPNGMYRPISVSREDYLQREKERLKHEQEEEERQENAPKPGTTEEIKF